MTTKKELEREEARDTLRDFIQPGDTVYTVLRHVSRSGMTRDLDLYVIQDNEPRWITRLACRATDRQYNERAEAMRVGGCGMDMGFDAVYALSRALFPEGFGCIGQGCPSNDHSNGDRDYTVHLTMLSTRLARELELEHAENDQTPIRWNVIHDVRGHATGTFERDHWHNEGGYALSHRWM